MGTPLEDLHESRLTHVADVVAFVLDNDALGTDVNLVVFAKKFGSLVRVFEAKLLCRHLLLLFLLLLLLCGHVPLTVEVVENCEVFYQLLDVGAEVTAAGRAGENVARAQIHETVLAEGVAAGENPGDLVLVIVLVETDGTGDFHSVVFVRVLQRDCLGGAG